MTFEKVHIGDYVTLRQGFAINKKSKHHIANHPTDLHLLRIGDMKDGTFSVYVNDTIPKQFVANVDDIIYTRTGQVGLVFRGQHGVIHNNCFSVTPKDEKVLNRDYLFYALQTPEFYSEANSRATGAAQPDLPHSAFNSIYIPLPDLQTQIAIAKVLSAYDDLIKANNAQIRLIDEAISRLYTEWFVRLNYPGHEQVKIKEGLPLAWKVSIIGEYFDLYLGGTPSRANNNFWSGGTIPWINSGAINQSRILEGNEYITELALEKSATKLLPRHCTLVAITGATLGQVSYNEIPVCANQSVVAIKEASGIYDEYMLFYIKENIAGIINKANGSAQQHINKGIISDYKFIVPDRDTITRFHDITSSLNEKLYALMRQNSDAKVTRDMLIPKLLSGVIKI